MLDEHESIFIVGDDRFPEFETAEEAYEWAERNVGGTVSVQKLVWCDECQDYTRRAKAKTQQGEKVISKGDCLEH